jgi:Pvc16 N-terminal domain
MIDQIDQRLKDWVKETLEGVDVSLGPPKLSQTGQGVNLYLMEFANKPAPRSNTPPPVQILLRYLVTAWAKGPEESHPLLGKLVFAAMTNPEFEVEFDPIPATAWVAFGVPPLPSFVLTIPLRLERPEPPTKLVRKPLVLQSAPITSLSGIVLGPEDVPLSNARVELRALQLYESTDTKGRFRFPAVPSEPRAKQLRIKAKGRELTVTVQQPDSDSEPVVIHFNLFD